MSIKSIFILVTKSHLTRSLSASNTVEVEPDDFLSGRITVLIFQIPKDEEKPVGLLSENSVLDMKLKIGKEFIPIPINAVIVQESTQEKRTRFSISHEEGSIGNTSDNLEAISEAASNHSVTSSLELENEDQNDNDNLSDMVSANVSGRGTPNISGRDTPSSQLNDNEERALPEARQQFAAPPHLTKQIRSEIDDKFCKFEIKKLLEGDETISIISDTWSTDVLASDSETIDAGDGRQEQQCFAPIIEQPLVDPPISNPLLDISETQSESAWSTDVLASDTERLTEVDNDDIASVARSDDASSVARSDDVTRSEGDDNLQPDQNLLDRRLSNPSYQYVNNLDVHYVEYRRESSIDSTSQVRSGQNKEDNRQIVDGNANNVIAAQKSSAFVDTSERVNKGLRPQERRSSDGTQNTYTDGALPGNNIFFECLKVSTFYVYSSFPICLTFMISYF